MNVLVVLWYLIVTFDNIYSGIVVTYTNKDRTFKDSHFFPMKTNFLQFYVKAKSDVNVMLSEMPILTDANYNIGFGVEENTKSWIRRNNDVLVEQKGTDANESNFDQYWVDLDDAAGTITAGKGVRTNVLLHVKDPDYLKMKYFGLVTGWGAAGEWHFDANLIDCNCAKKCNNKYSILH